MYRIEVSPGEETVFRTIEELATGIRNGLVTTRSRIYHGASQKWLPIEFHPHYKKALQSLDRPRPAAAAAVAPVPQPAPVPWPEPFPPAAKIAARPTFARSHAPPVPAAAASLPFIQIELPPMEYPMAPAASSTAGGSHGSHGSQLPVARRRRASSRPLLYAGAAVILVVVGYLATSAAPSGKVAAETVPAAADVPSERAEPALVDAELDGAVTTADSTPEVAPIPARVPPSGPPSQAWSSSAGASAPLRVATPPAAAGVTPSPVIAPAPGAMNLALPSLLVAESLAPKAASSRDTAAIKRILKVVTGIKPAEIKAAQ